MIKITHQFKQLLHVYISAYEYVLAILTLVFITLFFLHNSTVQLYNGYPIFSIMLMDNPTRNYN